EHGRVGDAFGVRVGHGEGERLGRRLRAAPERLAVGVAVDGVVDAVHDPQVLAGPRGVEGQAGGVAVAGVQAPVAQQPEGAVGDVVDVHLVVLAVGHPEQAAARADVAGAAVGGAQRVGVGRALTAGGPAGGALVAAHLPVAAADDPHVGAVGGDALRRADVLGRPRAEEAARGGVDVDLLVGIDDPQLRPLR